MNDEPKINAFELHLSPDPEFTRKGWGKKVRALGGNFRPSRGHDDVRFVDVPDSEAGRKLIGELLARFPRPPTVVIVRHSHNLGDSNAPTSVHYVKRGADPYTAIEAVVASFQRRYRAVMAQREVQP